MRRKFLVPLTTLFVTVLACLLLPCPVLPAPPDPEEGRIVLYGLAEDGVTRAVMDPFADGPTFVEPPPSGPGRRFAWNGSARDATASPGPTTLSGAVATFVQGDCSAVPTLGIRLAEVLFECADGHGPQPFVELVSVVANARYPDCVAVESYSHDGTLLQTLPIDFGVLTGGSWTMGDSWLVAGNSFSNEAGDGVVEPDTRATPVVDPSGGMLRLVQWSGAGTRLPFDSLRYGPGGYAFPPAGRSLNRTYVGGWFVDRPTPRTHGGAAGVSECLDLCPISEMAVGDVHRSGHDPGYWSVQGTSGLSWVDHANGQARTEVWNRAEGSVTWRDEFVATGLPDGTEIPVQARLVILIVGHPEVCSAGRCVKGAASIDLYGPGGAHVGDAVVTGGLSRTVAMPLQVRVGEPFVLEMRCQANSTTGANGAPTPIASSFSQGYVQVFSTNPYVRLLSCKGMQSVSQATTGAGPGSTGDRVSCLAIRQVTPNPTRGPAQLTFALPRSGAVSADVIDVAGRRVLAREWGELAAGAHTLPLAAPGELAPGFYLVRVRQAGESASGRLLVIR